MIQLLVRHFSTSRFGLMTRQSYHHERYATLAMSLASASVEGSFVGIVARKTFGADEMQVALLVAAPMFANLTSYFWSMISRGRPKIRMINLVQALVLSCLVLIALLPANILGAWALTGLVIIARCGLAGLATLRSTVWRLNYPRNMRGQITSRLTQLMMVNVAISSLLAATFLDFNDQLFRVVYVFCAVMGLIAIYQLSHVRLRQEPRQLRFERMTHPRPQQRGETGDFYELPQPKQDGRFFAILKQDPHFRSYMSWQFLGGMSNMMIEPPLLLWVAAKTTQLRSLGYQGYFTGDYSISVLILTTVPMIVALMTAPLWGRKLDAMHILRFRLRQGAFWSISQFVTFIGVMLAEVADMVIAGIAIVAAARLLLGIARGGGMLAWNLGHNDFASRELVTSYMGVHMTLTGIRGAFAPLLGTLLFVGVLNVPGTDLAIPMPHYGAGVFLIAACLSVISMIGFYRLYHQMGRPQAMG